VAVTKTDYKPTSQRAVAIPSSTISYNPSFTDHQQAVGEAVAIINKEDEAKQKLKEKLSIPAELRGLADPYKDERVTQILHQMEEGFSVESEEEEQNDEPIKKITRRKTTKERKQKKRKIMIKMIKIRKHITKIQQEKVGRAPEIAKQLEVMLSKQRRLRILRKLKRIQQKKIRNETIRSSKV